MKKIVYALGFFDGVHLGHQALLAACRELAEKNGCQTGVVTFTSHPDSLVSGTAPRLLITTQTRRDLLSCGLVENVVELPFNKELMQMPWRDFVRMLRAAPYHAAGFVCGSDFHFGHKGEGTAETLQQYCNAAAMPCTVVPQLEKDGIRVSSTYIRSLIEAGQVEKAAEFLGHPHILTGKVVGGKQLGRTIGVPTANMQLPREILCPKFGVYACKARVGEREYLAVTNVGKRPTVGGSHVTVEPWILDFEGDLYGKEITLLFYKFLRPEQKFDSLEELKTQIQKDARATRECFE